MASLCLLPSPALAFDSFEYPRLHPVRKVADELWERQFSRQVRDNSRAMSLQVAPTGSVFGSATITQSIETNRRSQASYTARQVAPLPSEEPSTAAIENGKGSEGCSAPEVSDSVSVAQYDMDVKSIVQRVQQNVVIKDMPIKSPRWIQLPKGYLVDLEVRPAKHYKARAEIKKHVNKRKREATLPETSLRGWRDEVQGFRPEEVVWNGAIGFKDCEPDPSSLTNDIHPLFDRSCFDDTPDAIYDQLTPGLQLATLFLTQPVCMQFWVTLAMGKRRHDPEMSARDGRPSQRIDQHVELTKERAKTVIDLINHLGKDKMVHFRFNNRLLSVNNTKEDGYAYGVSAPICDYKGIDTEYHGVSRSTVRSIVRFHADYYVVAKKLSQLKYPDMSQKLRFNFGYAVLLVHELVHSIEGIHFRGRADQWVDFQHSGYYREPYWLDWGESELGRAWEETMFGGHLQPTNGRVDGSHGLAVADWPFGDNASKPSPKSHRWWTVSMDYIVWIFKQETWQKNFDLNDRHVFNIPRDGAASLCINSFTTMDPSEEWRVAKEDAAALIAQSNEEPAKKKRVKALGNTEEKRPDQTEVIQKVVVKGEQKASESQPKRQVPMFPGTRRLSSVMPGPLPDFKPPNISRRETLTPHTRKPSNDSSTSAKSLSKSAFDIVPEAYNGYTPRQLKFLNEQRLKDQKQRVKDEALEKILPANRPNAKDTTAELVKKFGSRPLGILGRYKKRKKAELERKRADERRRRDDAARLMLEQKGELGRRAGVGGGSER